MNCRGSQEAELFSLLSVGVITHGGNVYIPLKPSRGTNLNKNSDLYMKIYSSQLWNQTRDVKCRNPPGRVPYGKRNKISNKMSIVCHHLPLFAQLLKSYWNTRIKNRTHRVIKTHRQNSCSSKLILEPQIWRDSPLSQVFERPLKDNTVCRCEVRNS